MTNNDPIRSRTVEMHIGNTTYIVTSFNVNARENVEQRLLRFIAERVRVDIENRETA